MPFCPREARLIDGGWDSNVFGTAVWQPVVDIGQVCWLHRDGLVQFCWPNHGGPVQSRLQHHGGPVQVCWQHRGGPLQFPWQHRDGSGWQCCVAGPVDGAGACWLGLARPVLGAWLWPLLGLCPPLQHPCAKRFPRSDMGLPLLTWTAGWACSMVVVGVVNAGMLVWCASSGMSMPLLAAMIALVVGSMLSRPVTVSGAMFACLAWHPHLFSWCASKIPGTATLSFARPKVASFPRTNTLVTVEAFLAEGSMNRPLLDLGTPGPMAFGGCLCNGCPSDLFADWLTLLRVVLSARPRRHLISCLTSYFLWASLETSAMLEEALEISRDCVLLADMDGVLQADGEDLVNEAIPEAADSIIREVAAKILGADAPSDGSDPPIALAKMGPSPSASPPKSGLSKSAPAGLRRAAMPVVPEHQEFDEWCAARSRTPPANVAVHPSEARVSSIPPPRPHKRQAPSSDPLRAKRSWASASSSSRIPSSTKAGMSSVNNSPAETARQSRREK
ncbi:hypothetical protein V6N11_018413 [Hibiscus sabdariffa]|uniref:Uncharacterized protein n=1 Tax=Hibiscus sabdariffa TaxID=183260 RepID=A0ABR2T7U9_9ROSI